MENLPHLNDGKARDQVGKVFAVSGKSVDHATKVLRIATPEVVKAVTEGRMAVSTAAVLATEPRERQEAEAMDPRRRRSYSSLSRPIDSQADQEKPANDGEIKVRGVGVFRANEAINSLSRIPKNDALRKRGFQIVTDWIRHNR